MPHSNEKTEVILGLDPGYADTGWGVIKVTGRQLEFIACGSIQTSKKLPLSKRLVSLASQLDQIIKEYHPDQVGIEQLFFNTNTTTAIKVAQARGVLLLITEQHQLPLTEPTPSQIKQSLTNSGNASKQQLARMVVALLKLDELPKPDDATDALACAICTSFQHNMLI